MQWFSNGILFDTEQLHDEQRFIGGVLLDGPGPLDTDVGNFAEGDQDAPFGEEDGELDFDAATEAAGDQTAPFAEQDAQNETVQLYASATGIVIDTDVVANAIRTAVAAGYSQVELEFFGHGELGDFGEATEAAGDQDAPFGEQDGEGLGYVAREITGDEDAPFGEQDGEGFRIATSGDIDQDAPFTDEDGHGDNPQETDCGRGTSRRRRCCCCGQMEPQRAFPFIESSSHGITGTNDTTHVVDLPGGVEEDDLLLVFFCNDEDATASITNPAAGWTQLFSTANGTEVRLSAFYRWAAGGEAQITITTSSTQSGAWACCRVSGADTSVNPVAASALTDSSSAPYCPTCNPWSGAALKTRWFAAFGWDGNKYRLPASIPLHYSLVTEDRWAASTGNGISIFSRALKTGAERPGFIVIRTAADEWVTNTIGVMGAVIVTP